MDIETYKKLIKSKKKPNKFRNKKTKCRQGHTHDSKFEAEYCDIFMSRKKKRVILDYDTQASFSLLAGGELICAHYPDFMITILHKVGMRLKNYVVDTKAPKALEDPKWRIKAKLFIANYPNIPYHIISNDGTWVLGLENGRLIRNKVTNTMV